ncbi:phage antirepressor N-terminal domain-containing protein [Cellulomonas sp. ES6]|uniref:phage antirepressor N-terminal domain-containing protein n=1 Tax=Cellulomonas sp. ES6 TaxID=3039384 RepID=UPI0024B68A69|nr:phage antirepressor N-terminal domain-containing protein [Cellulomonas sp. ES6]WHP18808.1 phage antirepressor N-terminal domain-containing protein [Cellulomonas sp. ES6]
MTDLIRIPFHDAEVLAVDIDGKPHIVLKPAIDALGVDYDNQRKKLEDKSWATTVLTTVVAADGKRRQMLAVDVRTFLMLLATIDERRVGEAVRPLLVAYQSEVADVIEAYWTNGGAINPRATHDQLTALAQQAEAQMNVIRLASGIIAPDYLEAKARLVLARSMGEEPEIEDGAIPVDVYSFLKSKGVKAPAIARWSGSFGKRLKALYVAERGCEPEPVSRFVNGTWTEVKGYFKRDLPLFERVYDIMRADLTEVAA